MAASDDGALLAITGGRVVTVTAATIDGGAVIIEGGRIRAVGAGLRVPTGARVFDASGMWVMPGLIDSHSHLGLLGDPGVWANDELNEATEPVTAHLRGQDGFNPDDPALAEAVKAGITAAFTGPGSANVIGGTGFAFKLRGGTLAEMAIAGSEAMKMALGENPKRLHGQSSAKRSPATRMGNAAVLREALVKAQNHAARLKWREGQVGGARTGTDGAGSTGAVVEPEPVGRDLGLEALGRVVGGQMRARIHAHRADDILTALRIAEEFGLDAVIEHCTEGYKVAAEVARRGVMCTVGPFFSDRTKMELKDERLSNAAALVRAGVRVALQMDGAAQTAFLPLCAGVAVREGMPEEDALRAVTINAAAVIGAADRLGSLEPGKDADIAIFDGHPFCTFTRCMATIIDGVVVWERPPASAGGAYRRPSPAHTIER